MSNFLEKLFLIFLRVFLLELIFKNIYFLK